MASACQRTVSKRTFTARNVAAALAIGALGNSAVVAPAAGATGNHGTTKLFKRGGSGLGSIDLGSLDGASLGKTDGAARCSTPRTKSNNPQTLRRPGERAL